MLLSHGPFERTIPLPVVERVAIKQKTPERTTIQLEISNETSKPRSQMDFANLIVFTTERSALDGMSSLLSIRNFIRTPGRNVRKKEFMLSQKDFVPKAFTASAHTPSQAKQKVYSNSYKMTVSFPSIENLYVMVVSYREYNNKIFVGTVTKETLFQDGSPPLRARVYRLAETVEPFGVSGSVWPGAVHRHNNTLMAGDKHIALIPHPTLTSTSAPNYKFVDKRFLMSAQDLQFDNTSHRSAPSRTFSDVELSRSEEGMVHGSVSFDLLSYAKNNSNFGKLIKNDKALLSAFTLDDATVYRRVVNPGMHGNSLTPSMMMKCNLQSNTSYEPIATLGNDLRAVGIDAGNSNGIIPMSFVDKDAARLDSGALQYKLELVFSDKTHEAITFLRNDLLVKAKSYRPGHSGDWPSLISDYLAGVSFVFGSTPFTRYSLQTWHKNLMAMATSPNYKSTDQQAILQIVNAFVDGLSGLLSVPLGNDSSPQNFNSKIYNSKKDAYRRMEKILANNYEIKDRKNVGISYMGNALGNKGSVLPSVGANDLRGRLDAELTKYSVANSNAVSVNRFGYVSPESIRLADAEIETTTLSASTDTFSSLIRSNTSNRTKLAPERQKSPGENKSNILSNLGIGVQTLDVDLQKVLSAERRQQNTIDSDQYLGSGSVFVRADDYLTAAVSGSNNSIIVKDGKQNAVFNAGIVNDLVEKSTLGFKDGLAMTNSSVIEGSLALSKFDGDAPVVAGLNPISRNINFNSVAKIEYLKSYDARLRCGKLNWEILDERTWTKAVESNAVLLCRLVKTSHVLDAPDMLDLQPLGSLFALGAPRNIRRNPNYRKELALLRTSMGRLGSTTSQPMMIQYASNTPITGEALQQARATTTTTRAAQAQPATRRMTRNRNY